MQVLIGVDGSTGSFQAARLAALLTHPGRDQITLYYAPPPAGLHPRGGADPQVVERARQAMAQAVLAEATEQLGPDWAGRVKSIIGTQKPEAGLLRAADELQADLIVVGAHGAGPLEKLLVGSVSSAIARSSQVPVLVVRGAPPEGAPRVLWACDGSESSRAGETLLSQLQWPAGTEGRLIRVIESLFAGEIPAWLAEKARDPETEAMAQAWVASHEAERQAAADDLKARRAQLPTCFQNQEPIVAEGNPAEQILKAASSQSANLIVVGARGLGAVARFLMGSTSERVLKHAHCSVLVVHQRTRP